MKKLICLLIIAMLLSGCATMGVSEVMASWVGRHMSELISSWGPPTREMSDGADGRILIYETVRAFTTQQGYTTTTYSPPPPTRFPLPTQAKTVYHPPKTSSYIASRLFWVNSDGIIYRWSWKGL